MAQMKKAAKKADPMKASAASHQRDLAKTSGMTQANNAAATPGRPRRAGTYGDYKKAKAETLKSFGLSTTKAKATTKPAAKPAARSKAGASTVSAVAKRFGVTAREARDIAKAIGNVAESAVASKNIKNPQQQYLGGKALKASVKDLKKQVKETGRAAKSGTTGTRAGKLSYNIDTGSPQGLKGKERPKYRGSLTQY